MEEKNKVHNLWKENNEPMKAGEINESIGVDKKEVNKEIKELKAEELIGSPKRCYYAAN